MDGDLRHLRRARKRARYGGCVAALDAETHATPGACIGQRDGRQRLVLDVDQLRRIDRLRSGPGDHQDNGLADIADFADGEDRLHPPVAIPGRKGNARQRT